MKLFYYKGACSLAVRIIINELDIKCDFEPIKELQVKDKQTQTGEVFAQISPKNQIPVLILENGEILTECIAIMQYLADLKKDTKIIGEANGFGKYRVLEWLSFIATEVHKNFIPMIHPIVPLEAKPVFKRIFLSKIKYIEAELQGKDFLTQNHFTLADAYLFVILTWFRFIQVEMEDFPNIKKYFESLKERPSIAKSLKDEI